MFNILDRYIGKIIFSITIMMLFILVILSSIIKFLDQLKKTGHGNYNTFAAGMYTLLSVPKDVQVFFPMAELIGVLVGLGILAHRKELIVMQASGYTQKKIGLSVIKTAIPLILLITVLGEFVTPRGVKMAYKYGTKAAIYGQSLVSTKQGIWIKNEEKFINIKYVKDSSNLEGITILSFNKKYRLESVRYATAAVYDKKNKLWLLLRVEECFFDDHPPKKIINSHLRSSTWKTNITPNEIKISTLEPDALSISELNNYIRYLKATHQDPSRYQLNMWNKIFNPLLTLVMILMSMTFISGPLCVGSMNIKIVSGISFVFIFYAINQIFGPLMLVCGIPPIIGSMIPSVNFFIAILWILLK